MGCSTAPFDAERSPQSGCLSRPSTRFSFVITSGCRGKSRARFRLDMSRPDLVEMGCGIMIVHAVRTTAPTCRLALGDVLPARHRELTSSSYLRPPLPIFRIQRPTRYSLYLYGFLGGNAGQARARRLSGYSTAPPLPTRRYDGGVPGSSGELPRLSDLYRWRTGAVRTARHTRGRLGAVASDRG